MDNGMEYSVLYDAAISLISIRVTGNVTMRGITQMSTEVIELAKAQNCGFALFDYSDAVLDLSTVDIFDFMSQLDKVGVERSYVVAIIYAQDEGQYKFAETVAFNRGWPNVRYFPDRVEAEQWLESKRSSGAGDMASQESQREG